MAADWLLLLGNCARAAKYVRFAPGSGREQVQHCASEMGHFETFATTKLSRRAD